MLVISAQQAVKILLEGEELIQSSLYCFLLTVSQGFSLPAPLWQLSCWYFYQIHNVSRWVPVGMCVCVLGLWPLLRLFLKKRCCLSAPAPKPRKAVVRTVQQCPPPLFVGVSRWGLPWKVLNTSVLNLEHGEQEWVGEWVGGTCFLRGGKLKSRDSVDCIPKAIFALTFFVVFRPNL